MSAADPAGPGPGPRNCFFPVCSASSSSISRLSTPPPPGRPPWRRLRRCGRPDRRRRPGGGRCGLPPRSCAGRCRTSRRRPARPTGGVAPGRAAARRPVLPGTTPGNHSRSPAFGVCAYVVEALEGRRVRRPSRWRGPVLKLPGAAPRTRRIFRKLAERKLLKSQGPLDESPGLDEEGLPRPETTCHGTQPTHGRRGSGRHRHGPAPAVTPAHPVSVARLRAARHRGVREPAGRCLSGEGFSLSGWRTGS